MAGLYYDPDALRSAEALIKGWTADDRQKLRDDAPLLGLAAEIRGRELRAVALDMLAIAHGGLKRRARLNARARTKRSTSVHSRRLRKAAASRRGIGSSVTRARGAARSSRRLTRRRFSDPTTRGGDARGQPHKLRCLALRRQRAISSGFADGNKRSAPKGAPMIVTPDAAAADDSWRIDGSERAAATADPLVGPEMLTGRDIAVDLRASGSTRSCNRSDSSQYEPRSWGWGPCATPLPALAGLDRPPARIASRGAPTAATTRVTLRDAPSVL